MQNGQAKLSTCVGCACWFAASFLCAHRNCPLNETVNGLTLESSASEGSGGYFHPDRTCRPIQQPANQQRFQIFMCAGWGRVHAPRALAFHLVFVFWLLIRVTGDAGVYPASCWAEAETHPGEAARAGTSETIISSVVFGKSYKRLLSSRASVFISCVYLWSVHKHPIWIFFPGTVTGNVCCKLVGFCRIGCSYHCVCAQKERSEFREEPQSTSFFSLHFKPQIPPHINKHTPAHTHMQRLQMGHHRRSQE